jgi:fumarylacetoacetase
MRRLVARAAALPNGETRCFLEDGDQVTLRGAAQGDGYRIGVGASTRTILPAKNLPDWARQQGD